MEISFGNVDEGACSVDNFKGNGWVPAVVLAGFGENRKPFFIASAALKPVFRGTLKSLEGFIINERDAVLEQSPDLEDATISELWEAMAEQKIICMLSNNGNGRWNLVCFKEVDHFNRDILPIAVSKAIGQRHISPLNCYLRLRCTRPHVSLGRTAPIGDQKPAPTLA
jgi:hypothetical protein